MQSFINEVNELKKIPNTSGLYYFYAENDEILYIGKAKNLKSRINSHQIANELHRQGVYLRKITLSKGFQPFKQDELPEELRDAWNEFFFKGMGKTPPIVIDYIFHKIKKIEVIEMSHSLTKDKEKEMIEKIQPPFNSQTASKDYYRIQEEFE